MGRKKKKIVQATTAIVEKTVMAFYSTITVVSTKAVVCCSRTSEKCRESVQSNGDKMAILEAIRMNTWFQEGGHKTIQYQPFTTLYSIKTSFTRSTYSDYIYHAEAPK